jgi:colicin import membrane protein
MIKWRQNGARWWCCPSFFISIPTVRPIEGVVYEVNLVEMPRGGELKPGRSVSSSRREGKTAVRKNKQAKRIRSRAKEKKEKPLVIAKRTVKRGTSAKKKPKLSTSQRIDRAISRIEKKVKSGGETHVDRAISKLERKLGGQHGSGSPGSGSVTGIPIRIYQMEVESKIKDNWAYPVALQDSRNLEAIVVVMVRKNGTIIKTQVKKKSSSAIFDQSVLKAIERSDPLPPFPEGYKRSYDEIEINFNLKDLENY